MTGTMGTLILYSRSMPELDGLSAIQQISEQDAEIAIIILTTFNEDAQMVAGLQAGAKGFLLKDTERSELLNTIRAAARGETLLQPEVMQRLLAYQQHTKKTGSNGGVLSEREMEVLQRVAEGNTNKQIAYLLGISDRTVKAHLTSIYNKFGVDSRAAAIAHAAKEGLL